VVVPTILLEYSHRKGEPAMILLIDNYDSFTYNLVQRLGEIDSRLDLRVHRNDRITPEEIAAMRPERIIVSPGPCTPKEAGISKTVIERFGPTTPVLGVCLGHQCIGEVFGWVVNRNERLMHGKVSQDHHDNTGVFAGLPNPFTATR
jgi:anthranilate synthase/aminodeoxychorismate synthase-like glutamine amidotransferase